jgi:hypothetical protein
MHLGFMWDSSIMSRVPPRITNEGGAIFGGDPSTIPWDIYINK